MTRSRRPARNRSLRAFGIVDLFCGCGGLTLGASEAAHANGRHLDVRLAVDVSDQALTVFRRNFAECAPRVLRKQVEELFPGEVGASPSAAELQTAASVGAIDALLAGPPCQGHSDLNNNTRRSDPRNALYLRAVRAAEVLQPRAVLIENVPGVVHDEGEVIAIAHRFLSLAGYQVRDFVIDSQDLGLPQTRRRHVLIALRDGEPPSTIARPAVDQPATLRDYIGDLVDEPRSRTGPFYDPGTPSKENKRRIDYLFDNGLFDLPNSQRPPCHRDRAHSYVSMYGRLRWDAPAGTITSGFGCMGQGRYVHPSRRRTLTPHEAARVQGFPDFYDFSDVRGVTSLREMIGNAVPPRLSAIVMDQLFHAGAFRYATC